MNCGPATRVNCLLFVTFAYSRETPRKDDKRPPPSHDREESPGRLGLGPREIVRLGPPSEKSRSAPRRRR
jgi:hypothetical protein